MSRVYIVGVGPGDPELITLKALKIIRRADVVVYGRLVNESILSLTKPGCEKIYVGGGRRGRLVSQEEINELLLKKASEGKVVARLKNGDPYVFGRGAEEYMYLLSRGVSCEVIPGITSITAAPLAAGIPLTFKGISSSFAVVPGVEPPGHHSTIRYDMIAKYVDTIVILMGVSKLERVVEEISRARDLSTPVAIVENATLPRQRVIVGDLSNIVEIAAKAKLSPPATIIVGDTVRLREKLWRREL